MKVAECAVLIWNVAGRGGNGGGGGLQLCERTFSKCPIVTGSCVSNHAGLLRPQVALNIYLICRHVEYRCGQWLGLKGNIMGATRGLFIERFSNDFEGWDHVSRAADPNRLDADPDPVHHLDTI
jgi:hypothetical protein